MSPDATIDPDSRRRNVLTPTALGQRDAFQDGGQQLGLGTVIGLRADLLVVEQRKDGHLAVRLGGQERLEARVAGGLVVQPRRADQVEVRTCQRRRGEVVGHQVKAEDVGGVHPGAVGDEAQERPRPGADAPHRVDVTLRVQ